jgi:hypothetical protein
MGSSPFFFQNWLLSSALVVTLIGVAWWVWLDAHRERYPRAQHTILLVLSVGAMLLDILVVVGMIFSQQWLMLSVFVFNLGTLTFLLITDYRYWRHLPPPWVVTAQSAATNLEEQVQLLAEAIRQVSQAAHNIAETITKSPTHVGSMNEATGEARTSEVNDETPPALVISETHALANKLYKGGRPRNPDDDWAWQQVNMEGRAPEEVYPEWLKRIGVRAKRLADAHDSFNKAIRKRRLSNVVVTEEGDAEK